MYIGYNNYLYMYSKNETYYDGIGKNGKDHFFPVCDYK